MIAPASNNMVSHALRPALALFVELQADRLFVSCCKGAGGCYTIALGNGKLKYGGTGGYAL